MSIATLLTLAAQIVPLLISIGTSAKDAWDLVKGAMNDDGTVNEDGLQKLRDREDAALATIERRAQEAGSSS